jgi:hypothetical protein
VGDKKPLITWGRCEKMAKPRIKELGLERMKRMIDEYFKTKDPFYRKVAYSLEFFLKADTLNKFNQICQ